MKDKGMEVTSIIFSARKKDAQHADHPSRDDLLKFLADVESEAVQDIRTHVHGCKSCQDYCFMLDPELDHQ